MDGCVSLGGRNVHTHLNTPARLKAERVRDYKASWTRFRGDILKAPPKQHLPSDSPLLTVSVVLASAFMQRPWDYHIGIRDLINRLKPRSWRAGSSDAAALLHFSFLINLSVMFFFLPFFHASQIYLETYFGRLFPALMMSVTFASITVLKMHHVVVSVFLHDVCITDWSTDVHILQLVL